MIRWKMIKNKMEETSNEEYEQKMREKEDIRKAENEFFDRVWYMRHKNSAKEFHTWNPDILAGALKAAKEVEEKYGKQSLRVKTNYDAGFINGKLSALRWVLGDEWDFLDT